MAIGTDCPNEKEQKKGKKKEVDSCVVCACPMQRFSVLLKAGLVQQHVSTSLASHGGPRGLTLAVQVV